MALPATLPFPANWSSVHSYTLLAAATILCLVPFSRRAFHVDDTLFVWCAQNIAEQPLNPYGFEVTWDATPQAMSDITQNPPLASYYAALAGTAFGWSERALHLSFLLITMLLVLGVYRLARKFTRFPLLAASATLLTPGLLVSASSVMCDTMMLAIWIWACVFWIEGLERGNYVLLILAAVLAGASALTKYFGISLIPLFAVYALLRMRRGGGWIFCLLIPVAILIGYQSWTQELYGHGLLFGAAEFAERQRAAAGMSWPAMAIAGASFAGGCALSGLAFAPLLWSRFRLAAIAGVSLLGALAVMLGWVELGYHVGGQTALFALRHNWLVGGYLELFILSGVSLVTLAVFDCMERKNADSVFLALWALGTFIFAAFVNYTVNARSVLPLIPAAGILIARQLEKTESDFNQLRWKVAVALVFSGATSLVVASADADLANSARQSAAMIVGKTRARTGTLWFEGHWGFQYYMEQSGAHPLDMERPAARPGDVIAVPFNNYQLRRVPPRLVGSQEEFDLHPGGWASTIDASLGAGFYSSYWGPLPYFIGPAPAEHYTILQLAAPHAQ
jgi:4-amino-4-deoxy-L-arabinose transferase-like glycosyltransferase